MTAQEMQAQIDALAVQLANLREEIAPAIAEGLRLFADRPPGEKGSPSLQFGRVEQVEDTYAYVTLDGQTDAVPINMLGGLVVGERVAVLLVPPSGNLAIGMVTPSVVPPVTPGTFGTVQVEAFLDPTGTSIAGGTTALDWVIDGTAVTLPNDTLLNLATPAAPVVIADGYFTFDMYVAPLGIVAADPVARVLYKIQRGTDIALFQPTQTPATAGGGGFTNANGFSFSYPCLAGDVITVQLEDTVTNIWTLGGSVKSIT